MQLIYQMHVRGVNVRAGGVPVTRRRGVDDRDARAGADILEL
jgi:hypothetical protein